MSDWADSLREYAQRVAGRDDTWKKRGLCNDYPEYQGSFLALEDEMLVDDDGHWVTGYEAQKRVVHDICERCPVQWECARWGIEVDEEIGVYAMVARERRWLLNQGDIALAIIDRARIELIPVHIAVHRAHYPPRV